MKNLEIEYRNSCQEETPDLWNRIEAALPEKTPLTEKMEQTDRKVQPIVSDGNAVRQQTVSMPAWTSKKKIIRFTRFAKAAAAILVLALVVPGAWFLMTQGKNGTKSDCAAADTAGNSASMDMTADYEPPAADAAAPEEMLDNVAGESVQNENAQFDTTMDSAMQEVGEAGQSPMEDSLQSDSLPSEVVQSEVVQPEEPVFMTVDEIVYDHGKTFYYLSDESGTIYIAVWEETSVDTENVGADETGAEGETISQELQTGESYYFTLQATVGKDWDYEILSVE
ncbi:MAG: hypothetical protein J6B90_06595 [Lachnospiraceae bacterium]|nr:hypothetical protein [Lachnospiraceae bacterium]